ncbi:MAG: DMT family protein [Bdellovibrionales bacterium]|nr:DMT family protein [Bdellovibrionales bacterium]
MTYAWYGHLKDFSNKPLWFAVLASWGIAFFEYCFQVPANRIGSHSLSLPQLKIIQEVIALLIFFFYAFYLAGAKPNLNYLWSALCLVGAVYFVFKN